MELDYTQTIEEAQSSYERQQLLALIEYLFMETPTEDLKSIAREIHYEVNSHKIVRGETPLPDLKYFGL